uniref:Death domain-containing protein n=1 Tax=Amphimedon queenslandica TaxID=400682 RepID=A0A1X7SNK3_AMPQE
EIYFLMTFTFVLLHVDTGDLDKIKTELKDFNISDWREFGSKAGLKYETLKIIQENNAKVQDRFEECLAYWLRRKDNVDDKGKPSWRRLAEILEELGDKALADRIRDRKGVPSDVHKEEQVKNVTTPDRSTRLPRFLEDDYLQMTTEFANILKRFVFEVFKEREEKLKGVQVSLVSISPSNRKEIDEVDSETGLTAVLRNYCSLSKFQVLTTLAKDMKMTDITDELNQFEEKRKKLYKEILAKDFAKSAIKYCGTTGSREVTFKVKWSFKKATLEDFEDFLNHAFSSLDIYIHLSAVHNSLLTFVCVIPHWLVDEMKDYIIKNGDLFESKGAVEITVDGTIVFSVKHSLEPHQLSLENEEKETESLQSEEEAEV